MKTRDLIGVAAIGSLLTGAVVGSVLAEILPRISLPEPASPELTVPNGRIGDVVEYLRLSAVDASARVEPEKRDLLIDGTWRVEGASRFIVEGSGRVSDGLGREREVVWFRTAHTGLPPPTIMTVRRGEALVPEYVGSWSEEGKHAIDAASRLQILSESSGASHRRLSYTFQDLLLIGLHAQNRSLQTGVELHSRTEIVGEDRNDYRAWVSGAGTIDEAPAYRVALETLIRPLPSGAGSMPFRHVALYWMRDTHPYPLVVQFGVTGYLVSDVGRVPDGPTYVLSAYTPGSIQIPWAELQPDERPTRSAYFAASGPIRRPTDGQSGEGRTLALLYPLSKAIEDAMSHPELDAFRSWRSGHPGGVLVAAHHIQPKRAEERWLWNLLWAEPDGRGYEVQLARTSLNSSVEVVGNGPRTVPSFALEELPLEPMTLSAASQAWNSVSSEAHRTAHPNYVQWGFRAWEVTFAASPSACELGLTNAEFPERRFTHPETGLWTLVVGRWNCEAETERYSKASFDTASGRIGSLSEYDGPRGQGNQSVFQNFTGPVPAPPNALHVRELIPLGFRAPQATVWEARAILSGAMFLAFLASYFLPFLKYELGRAWILLGYSKLKREELLDHRVRDGLVEAIRGEPGLSLTDLQSRLRLGWGTTVYHLSVLERNRLVSSITYGRHRRFFPTGSIDWSDRTRLALLANPKSKSVYDLIRDAPGIVQQDLAARARLTRPAIHWHLRRLEQEGLVRREKKARTVHYYPAWNRSPPGVAD